MSDQAHYHNQHACPQLVCSLSQRGGRTRQLTVGMTLLAVRWGTPLKPSSRNGISNSSSMSLGAARHVQGELPKQTCSGRVQRKHQPPRPANDLKSPPQDSRWAQLRGAQL